MIGLVGLAVIAVASDNGERVLFMIRKTPILICGFLLGLSVGPAQAATIEGNSIKLRWTEDWDVVNRRGREKSVTTSMQLILYVSTQGRFFTKSSGSRGWNTGREKLASPSDDGGAKSWQWRAFNRTITGVGRMGRTGVRHITIQHNGASCSATVGFAKKVGTEAIERRNSRGRRVSITSATASPASCTIESGNAFMFEK